MKDKIQPQVRITSVVTGKADMDEATSKAFRVCDVHLTTDGSYAVGFYAEPIENVSVIGAVAMASTLAKEVGPERALDIIRKAIIGT